MSDLLHAHRPLRKDLDQIREIVSMSAYALVLSQNDGADYMLLSTEVIDALLEALDIWNEIDPRPTQEGYMR